MPLDLSMIGSKFPALRHPVIFFDNPGGTQVAQPVLDRMNAYLVEHNANHGGAFETSCASDAVLDEACTFSRNDTRFKLRMDSLE